MENYEKLYEQFEKHPGPIDQYSDLRRMLRKSGFGCSKLFRGKDYKKDKLSGRFEVWVNTPLSSGKEGFGDSMGEAVTEAVKSLYQAILNRRRFSQKN